jgi:hypothetical protein
VGHVDLALLGSWEWAVVPSKKVSADDYPQMFANAARRVAQFAGTACTSALWEIVRRDLRLGL